MSELKVDKITPRQGTTLTLGDSGDTINFGSGVLPNFENLTVTGDLTVDTNSLKVDSTNNFVGIGTATPAVALDVVGAITATGNITGTLATAAQPNITSVGTLTSATISGDLTVDTTTLVVDSADNRVAINKGTPDYTLDVNGDIRVGVYNAPRIIFMDTANEANSFAIKNNNSLFAIDAVDASGTFQAGIFAIERQTSEAMRITSSGKVGIGTTSPTTLLEVEQNSTSGSTGSFPEITATNTNAAGVAGFRANGANGAVNLQLIALTDRGRISTLLNHPLTFMTNSAERMRIDSSGNVGIGATSITTLGSNHTTLQINGTSTDRTGAIRLRSSNNSVDSALWASTTSTFLASISNHPLQFRTNNTERMRINSSGKVYIGRQSDPYMSSHATKVLILDGGTTAGDTTITSLKNSSSTMYHFAFNNTNSVVGTISTSGSGTSYNTSSDYRLKENVVDITGATERLKQLSPKRFNFIADADTTVDGFLAHEVSDIVPEAITGTHNEVDADGNPVYQGIDQSKLVPLLVATIKELEARIEALENA